METPHKREGPPLPQGELSGLPGFYIPSETLRVIEDFLFSGFHVMLTGHSGCGKTTFGQVWAASRGMAVHKVNCGAIRSPRDWFGRHEFREGTGTVFVSTRFLEMLERPGLIILDEINRTAPENHNPILNLLDDNREVYVEELGRHVRVHPEVLFIATRNAGRHHTGTFRLDHALEDRFQEIRLELPPEEVIARLLAEKYAISAEQAEIVARVTVKLDRMYEEDLLSQTTGMRPAFAAAALLGRGHSLETALRYAFATRYSGEGGPESERTLVLQTIQGLVK